MHGKSLDWWIVFSEKCILHSQLLISFETLFNRRDKVAKALLCCQFIKSVS